MKTNKMNYLTPAINVIPMDAEDVLTGSPISGNDTIDNWMSDIFY